MSLSKNSFVGFLKATLAGGLLFLLPVVLVLIVFQRAMKYALGAAKPISHLLPVESVIGAYGEDALAIFMLILVSLLAGLVARTREGRRIMRWSSVGASRPRAPAVSTGTTNPMPDDSSRSTMPPMAAQAGRA